MELAHLHDFNLWATENCQEGFAVFMQQDLTQRVRVPGSSYRLVLI